MRGLLTLCCLAIGLSGCRSLPANSTEYEDMSFWLKSGQENLQRILATRPNLNRAKNVIVFIGDGMGISTITAGRIFKGQTKGTTGEEYKLIFEKFPNTALAKTYNVDKQVPDSAATATAIFSGVKTRYKLVGLDGKAEYNRCNKTVNQKSKVTTIVDWAQATGLDTGFVTTTRVTHATPAALYAHTNNRDWECDGEIPSKYKDCVKDIAAQLIEDAPGRNFKVMMGGGAQCMGAPVAEVDSESCTRQDDKNLVENWLSENPEAKLVRNVQDLMSLNITATSKILGLFAPGHLPYHAVRGPEVPSLANMTTQAVRMLKKNKKGFVLMVEGGKIDIAHHKNYARQALTELSQLEEAILAALRLVNLEETLIIVTADHSHAFTLNGYPSRGNDILGFGNKPDKQTYETLTYANGPGFLYHRRNDSQNVNETWKILDNDTNRATDPFYRHFAGIYLKDETHGGEDVGVYAIGPYSHLIRGTFEQNYIAHAVAYAACFKDWPSHCEEPYNRYYYDLTNAATAGSLALPVMLASLALTLLAL